jgi:enoyl-CoA hydratase
MAKQARPRARSAAEKAASSRRGSGQPADRSYSTLKVAVEGRIATITLNRPERLNAINDAMPGEIRQAVEAANADERVHVIVLRGAGSAFCAGYDLKEYAEGDSVNAVTQAMPWDPMIDYRFMKKNTEDFMSLWRSYKPTIARVHGYAAAGGSDIATCCDFIVMEDKARIGYMPVRVWGCPTPAMWVYRLGAMRAKRLMLTGDLIDGQQAYEWGLATDVAPIDQLDACVHELAERIAGVPKNQLMMLKLVINQAIDAMGLEHTQMFATVFDGITRHSPEGLWFKRYAEQFGFPAAVEWRDSGRPLPEPGPGNRGDEFMVPPPIGARSQWSRDVRGKRAAKPGGKAKAEGTSKTKGKTAGRNK